MRLANALCRLVEFAEEDAKTSLMRHT
jgi:hypothetical protein